MPRSGGGLLVPSGWGQLRQSPAEGSSGRCSGAFGGTLLHQVDGAGRGGRRPHSSFGCGWRRPSVGLPVVWGIEGGDGAGVARGRGSAFCIGQDASAGHGRRGFQVPRPPHHGPARQAFGAGPRDRRGPRRGHPGPARVARHRIAASRMQFEDMKHHVPADPARAGAVGSPVIPCRSVSPGAS